MFYISKNKIIRAMTLDQFIKNAEEQKSEEVKNCKNWLHKQIRMKINKDTVAVKKNWKIRLVKSNVSLLPEDDEMGNLDCNNEIITAIESLKRCYPLLNKEIRRVEPDCALKIENLLKEVQKNLKAKNPFAVPEQTRRFFEEKWLKTPSLRYPKLEETANLEFDPLFNAEYDYPDIEDLDLERVFSVLKDEDLSYYELFNEIIADDSYEGSLKLLRRYNFKPEVLPKDDDIFSRTLGCYSPSEERIYIYLNTIYDIARIKGISPLILFRKVLIHEMAHCLHHIGIDGDNKIWGDFGYRTFGKNTIEGLAQWYTYRYMYHYDKDKKHPIPINFLVTIWFSKYQPEPYRHYLTWHKYNYENLNRVLIEARKNTILKENSGVKFNRALEDNHDSNRV